MRTLYAIGFLILIIPAAAFAGGRIVKIEINNQTRISSPTILEILPVKEGDLLLEEKIEGSVETLKRWGRFSQIKFDKRSTPYGWVLTYTLKEETTVQEIHIRGNYPYLSTRLRRRISIRPGDLYDPIETERQTKRLEEFYEKEGYFGTKVTVLTEFDGSREFANLTYRIDRGDRYRFGRIDVQGNQVFRKGFFHSAINPLLPYKPARLREAIEKIEQRYQEKDYLQARMRVSELIVDHRKKKVHLTLSVREGQRVSVVFRGARRLKRKTLTKETPLFSDTDLSEAGIEESARALEEFYHTHGFLEASVRGKKERRGDLRVIFQIREGPEFRVKKVVLAGNAEISPRTIRKNLLTKKENLVSPGTFHPEEAARDVLRLAELYRRWGFPEAQVSHRTETAPLKNRLTVFFDIVEGEGRRVDSIEFRGVERFAPSRLTRLLKMKPGDRLDEEILKIDQAVLLSFYADRGHPYATLETILPPGPTGGTLTYRVVEGTPVTIGRVLPVGNRRTRPSAFEDGLDVKTGRLFSMKKYLKSESSLRRSGVFRSVELRPLGLEQGEPTVHMAVKVEENPVAIVDLESSYDTDDRFAGAVFLQYPNLFGRAKRGSLRLTGGQDVQKGEVNFADPRLLGQDLEAVVSGLALAEQRPGFSAVDLGGQVSVSHEFTSGMSLLTKYVFTRTNFRSVTDPTELSQRDHTTSKVGVGFSYDSRDSYANPERGILALLGTEVSNKILVSGFNFVHPSASLSHYQAMGVFTWINSVRFDGIKVFSGDVLTRDQRLLLGGDYSVRGFDQDAIGPVDPNGTPAGGTLLLMHSGEIQAPLKGDFRLAVFVDSGSLTNHFSEVGLSSWRHSAGLGLRYVTPIGPLRLDQGFKLDRQAGESFGRLHFAFGYAF